MTTCPKPATGAASAVYYVEELTCGVTPDNPIWNLFRRTSGNLQLTKDTLESNELDGSRDRADTRLGQSQTSGDLNVEMSYGSHDPFYAALLGSTWQAGANEVALDVTVDAALKTFTRSAGDYTSNYSVGDLVVFPSLTGDNALPFIATTVTATVITGAGIPDNQLTSEGPISTDIDSAEYLEIGDVCTSFSILEEYPDLNSGAGGYIITRGVKIVNLSYNLAVNALNTGTFQTLGLTQEIDAALPAGSTFPDVPKSEIYSGVDGTILQDESAIGFVTGVDATTDTEASAQFELGDNQVSFIEQGRVGSNLTLASFFVDFGQLEKFASETEVNLTLFMQSSDGTLVFSYPRVVYTSGAPDVAGAGSITQSLDASAFKPDTGSSIKIQRLA